MAKQENPAWTKAPKPADVPADQVVAFRNTAKAIAEFALQGRGEGLYVKHNRKRGETPKFTTLEDNLDAYTWNEEDDVLFKLTEDGRQRAIKQILATAYKTRDKRKKESDVLDAMPPAQWPASARNYYNEFKQGPLRQLENWIRSLPADLQSDPKEFYSIDFWNSMEHMGQMLFIENPTRKYAYHEDLATDVDIPKEAERIITPLPYAVSVVGAEKATRSIRAERPWYKKLFDLPNVRKIEQMGVAEQYEKSSGLWRSFFAKRAEKKKKPIKNKYQVTLGDAAMWSIADAAFRGDSLDEIVQPLRTLCRYTEKGDELYETVAENIVENARRAGIDLQKNYRTIPDETRDVSDRLKPLAKMQKRVDASVKNLTPQDRVKRNNDYEASTKILSMIHAHDLAAQKYSIMVEKLTKPRTAPEKGKDARNEGVLYLHDGKHLVGFESRINQPDTAGTIFGMVYHKKDDLYDILKTIGGLRLFGVMGFNDPQQLDRATKFFEGAQTTVVRGNPTGKLVKILAIEGGIWLAKKAYRNLRDRELYYNPVKAGAQVIRQAFTDRTGLIADVLSEKKIPDNPSKVVTEVSATTAKALQELRLPYVQPSRWGIMRSAISLSVNDAVREEDSVAFQSTMGAIHARRGYWDDATYFLGMADNWSLHAERDKKVNYEPHWRIFNHYQRSAMNAKRNMPTEHAQELLAAYVLAQEATAIPLPTNATTAKQMEAHIVRYPMQYKDRLTYLATLQEESPAEARAIAEGTINELNTIIFMAEQHDKKKNPDYHILKGTRREELTSLMGKYEKIVQGRGYQEPVDLRSAANGTQQSPAVMPTTPYLPHFTPGSFIESQVRARNPAVASVAPVVVLPRTGSDISVIVQATSPSQPQSIPIDDDLAWPAAIRSYVEGPGGFKGVDLDDPRTYSHLQKDYGVYVDGKVQS